MHLFLYGSLLDPRVLAERSGDLALPARLRPAVLRRWRRVFARDGRFPTLVPDRNRVVEGGVVPASAEVLRRLRAYEGADYRLTPIRVRLERGRMVRAFAWISPAAHPPWRP